jgi:hypothetical protein
VPQTQVLHLRTALINGSAEILDAQTPTAPLPNNFVYDFKIGDAIVLVGLDGPSHIPEQDEGPKLHGAEEACTQR